MGDCIAISSNYHGRFSDKYITKKLLQKEATKNDTVSFERNDQKSLKSVFFLKMAVLKFSENLSPELNETIALCLATNFEKSFWSVIFRKMFNQFP